MSLRASCINHKNWEGLAKNWVMWRMITSKSRKEWRPKLKTEGTNIASCYSFQLWTSSIGGIKREAAQQVPQQLNSACTVFLRWNVPLYNLKQRSGSYISTFSINTGWEFILFFFKLEGKKRWMKMYCVVLTKCTKFRLEKTKKSASRKIWPFNI